MHDKRIKTEDGKQKEEPRRRGSAAARKMSKNERTNERIYTQCDRSTVHATKMQYSQSSFRRVEAYTR